MNKIIVKYISKDFLYGETSWRETCYSEKEKVQIAYLGLRTMIKDFQFQWQLLKADESYFFYHLFSDHGKDFKINFKVRLFFISVLVEAVSGSISSS